MDERIDAVQKMQDYIAENLNSEITLADLAKVSLFSPWYSYRLFKEYIGISVADYIRKIRLSKSALKLRDEHMKIIDVAFELGFKSVDGYQRAFLKEFHCNPYQYSRNPIPIYLFKEYGIKSRKAEAKEMEKTKNIFIQLVEKPAHKVLIKRGKKATEYFEYCDEVGCDVWGLLLSIKSLCGEPVCLWLPDNLCEGSSKYVQGVEVELNYDGVVPEGFDIIELPAAKYLKLQGEPFKEEDYCQAIEEVQYAYSKLNLGSMGYKVDHNNPRIQLEPIGERGYIELYPVKSI